MYANVAYLITLAGISVMLDGKQFTVPTDHPNFARIKDALSTGAYDTLESLLDLRATVKRWLSTDTAFTLDNDVVSLDGAPFTEPVSHKVLAMIEAGHSPDPLFNFLRKARQNPSFIAQSELLLFCVANNFMIHTDGDIIAYKSVRDDYTDIYSGTTNVTVGATLKMARFNVDDNRHNTCSKGFHFASHEYASTWAGERAGHLMIMKVNPTNVVSIPSDYNNQKGRCCEYTVIAESADFKPLPKREVYDFGSETSGDEEFFDALEDSSRAYALEDSCASCDCEGCDNCIDPMSDSNSYWCDNCIDPMSDSNSYWDNRCNCGHGH